MTRRYPRLAVTELEPPTSIDGDFEWGILGRSIDGPEKGREEKKEREAQG
jgi:hypothetical protein